MLAGVFWGVADAVFGDETVEDVEDGVAVVGAKLCELGDAGGDGGVGVAERVGGSSGWGV